MRLYEIINVGITNVGDLGLTPDEIISAPQASTVMKLPLFKFEKGGNTHFFIKVDEEVIAWTYGPIFAYNTAGDNAFVAQRSFVAPEHRSKGIMYNLYGTLNERLKLTVMSDYQQSLEAKALWKKIYTTNKGKVKKYNSTTGDISDIVDFEEVYGDPELHLMLEMSINRKKMFESTDGFKPSDMVSYPCEAYYGYP